MEAKLWSWLARAGAAAFALALLETALAIDRAAYLGGELFAVLCLFVATFAVFAFWSSWLALTFALAEQKKKDGPTAGAAVHYSAMSGVALAAFALFSFRGWLERLGLDQPQIVRELELWANVVLIAASVLAARFIAFPIFSRLPLIFGSVRFARAIAAVLAALIAVRAASSGFEPLYLTPLAGTAGLMAILSALYAMRQIFAAPSRSRSRWIAAAMLSAMILAPLGACRQRTAVFALHNSAFVAGPLVRWLEISADLDGDGTFSARFGGSDCDDFDPQRGGGIGEIPGDGIDQDCRGGDAPKLDPQPLEVSLYEGCTIPDGPLSFLIITIESLRADRFEEERMPRLWAYAEKSVLYPRAYAPGTTMKSVLPALFGGAPLNRLSVANLNLDLSFRAREHVSAQLSKKGYDTAAYNATSSPGGTTIGFDSSFNWYRDSVPQPLGTKGLFNSAMVSTNAMSYLRAAEDPFLLWVHYADLQAPHLDPQLIAPRFRNVPSYDREVSYVDSHAERLLRFLDGSPLAERTVVFVMGAHGEDLGARGRFGHGRDLYEDVIRVPLIMRIPGCPPRVVPEPVSLTQIAPTIGLLADLSRSGAPLFSVQPAVVSEGVAVTYYNRAIVSGRYKMIEDLQSRGRLLFDLAGDPGETTNLYTERPELAAQLEAELQRWLDAAPNKITAHLKD